MSEALGPFRTAPLFREKIWAGDQLASVGIEPSPPRGTGEVWLVADLPGAASVIRDGPHAGRTLRDLVAAEPRALLGAAAEPEPGVSPRFPLLVKFLDIGPPLSVQVHPDGETARTLGDGERGKSEAWLVVAVAEEGFVLRGLKEGVRASDVPSLAAAGRLPEEMNRFQPLAGEGIEIVPGTLHTAEGVLVLEVQEASDITYRVYDYGRERGPLHLEQAAQCLERAPEIPGRTGGWSPGARELAPRSPFSFRALELAPEERLPACSLAVPRVLVVLSGRVSLGDLEVGPGQSVVLPACWRGESDGQALVTSRVGYAVAST